MFKSRILMLGLLLHSSALFADVKLIERYQKGDVNEVLGSIIHSQVSIDKSGKASLQDDPGKSWVDEDQAKIDGRDKTIQVGSKQLFHLYTINPHNEAARMQPTEDGIVNLDGKAVAEKIVQVRVSRATNDSVRATAKVVKIDPQSRKLVSLTECDDFTVGAFQYGTVTQKLCVTYTKDYCEYQKQTHEGLNNSLAGIKITNPESAEAKAVFARVDEAFVGFIDGSMSMVDGDALASINSTVEQVQQVRNPKFDRVAVVTGGALSGAAQTIGEHLRIYGPRASQENMAAHAYVFQNIGKRCDRLIDRELF
jgi:hypothetical protein